MLYLWGKHYCLFLFIKSCWFSKVWCKRESQEGKEEEAASFKPGGVSQVSFVLLIQFLGFALYKKIFFFVFIFLFQRRRFCQVSSEKEEVSHCPPSPHPWSEEVPIISRWSPLCNRETSLEKEALLYQHQGASCLEGSEPWPLWQGDQPALGQDGSHTWPQVRHLPLHRRRRASLLLVHVSTMGEVTFRVQQGPCARGLLGSRH